MSTAEQRFMDAADAFGIGERNLQPALQQMHDWLSGLVQALHDGSLKQDGLQPDGALARQVQAINANVKASERRWADQWERLRPAQALAQTFDEKAMLLVFGKFNAGKSSLCNFLAERFQRQGRSVRYFHLEAGQIVETAQRFREGAVETTARLQGVCLGEKLVLLDTPGLHSGTDKNAALTQRFLDSADGVLWLSSSTSPGQVQELDELARELRRSKPLLPVVTRSDFIEEDEVDGAIVKCLRNKTGANRALQEADVYERAKEKLLSLGVAPQLLRAPVSVSVHVAREQEETDAAMADAGFERLYGALLDITGPALAYKQRKPAEVLLHHLQEHVLGELNAETVPALEDLGQAVKAEDAKLARRQARMVQSAWREIIPELPALLERHASMGEIQKVCDEVTARLEAAFVRQVNEQLSDYVLSVPTSPSITPAECIGGEPLSVANQASYAGKTDEAIRQTVAMEDLDHEGLYNALERAVRTRLMDMAAGAVHPCSAALRRLEESARRMQELLESSGQKLHGIQEALRV
ncbi:dynamin family protein [Achromobacter sp. AONIH1]|uniref:dynamin family protein n=1 Tax=Achromobacter sp. AONIH1 TaxID=1758194 RepID=UPI000CD24EA5|nr:dynamin family protein [Achromobacter sp. AONIH1]AUT46357.1 hypothetical protein C2U31_10380 [Achromobacter sp. AONIH1]